MSSSQRKIISKIVRAEPQLFEWEIQDFNVFMSESQIGISKDVNFVGYPFNLSLSKDDDQYTNALQFEIELPEYDPVNDCSSRLIVDAKLSNQAEPWTQFAFAFNKIKAENNKFIDYRKYESKKFVKFFKLPENVEIIDDVSLQLSFRFEQVLHKTTVEGKVEHLGVSSAVFDPKMVEFFKAVCGETIQLTSEELELQPTQEEVPQFVEEALELQSTQGSTSESSNSNWDLIDENNAMESVGDVDSIGSVETALEELDDDLKTAVGEESEFETESSSSDSEESTDSDSSPSSLVRRVMGLQNAPPLTTNLGMLLNANAQSSQLTLRQNWIVYKASMMSWNVTTTIK